MMMYGPSYRTHAGDPDREARWKISQDEGSVHGRPCFDYNEGNWLEVRKLLDEKSALRDSRRDVARSPGVLRRRLRVIYMPSFALRGNGTLPMDHRSSPW